MATLQPDEAPPGGPVVNAIVGTGFRVGETIYPAGLLLTTERASAWSAPALDALTEADLAPLLEPAPEFILLGTGATLRRPAPALVKRLEGRGIGVEAMDSRAAARAWGLLRSEGRQIGAALLPL